MVRLSVRAENDRQIPRNRQDVDSARHLAELMRLCLFGHAEAYFVNYGRLEVPVRPGPFSTKLEPAKDLCGLRVEPGQAFGGLQVEPAPERFEA